MFFGFFISLENIYSQLSGDKFVSSEKTANADILPIRLVFSHPGDHDYYLTNNAALNSRPECEFGVLCYRKNPEHKKKFKHSRKSQI